MALRLVPRERVPLDRLARLLEQQGWGRQSESVAPEGASVHSTWGKGVVRALVALVVDPFAGWNYLLLEGADCDQARAGLLAALPPLEVETALDWAAAARSQEGLAWTTRLLGLLAYGPYQEDLFEAITCLAVCGDPQVQQHGLAAIATSAWTEFEDTLTFLLGTAGTDPGIRDQTAQLLLAMHQSDWNRNLRG